MTLHQKIKFVVNRKLIIISDEEGLLISYLSFFRYIKADEHALETSIQAFEIANVTFVEGNDLTEKANSSFSSLKREKSTIESGIPKGWGRIVDVYEKNDRFDLGYVTPSKRQALIPTKDHV